MNGQQDDQAVNPDDTTREECAFTEQHAAGYALGALDRFERGLVEQHLRWCPRCRDIVEADEKVIAYLPFLSPPVAPPSPGVRTALMESLAADIAGPIVDVPPVSTRRSGLSPAADPVKVEELPPTAPQRRARILPAAIIAPLAIALIVVSAWANSLQNRIDDQNGELADQQRVNGVIANGGRLQLFSMEPRCTDCTGRSQLGVDMDDSAGMVVAWNFDPKRKHSVWCVNDKGDKEWLSTLVIDPDGGAMQTFDFPGDASEYTEVYIADDNGSVEYMTNIAVPPASGSNDGQSAPSTPVSEPGQ